MNNRIEVIKQKFSNGDEGDIIRLFGKVFSIAPSSVKFRIVVHEAYPMIDENDIRGFTCYALERNAPVMAGTRAKVHPYRLMYIDKEGHDGHFLNIPQAIRGNRHTYPVVYQFVPALIAIPPHVLVSDLHHLERVNLYEMPHVKLLDESSLLERLLINSLRKTLS